MSYAEKLQQIDKLHTKIISYGKLPDEVLKKINYKFRLEWNYTSNSMEGNSLTRSETRSVMIGNITVSGKPIKDVLEMKGHDEVIKNIMKMGKGELNISEKRIKEIHRAIMHEEDPENSSMIGVWKIKNNYIYNYKNERFDFTAPTEVQEKMHSLINWLNAEKDKIDKQAPGALHPVTLAFRFHLEYITIHPFYDGNGRTSRILTNIILIAYGYPPIYIKENEKGIYYQYLADIQGYGGSPDVFYEYMGGLLLRSLQLVLDAIEGREIDEPEDLDKKIFLLEKELNALSNEDEIQWHLSVETFIKIYHNWLAKLIEESMIVIQKFNKFFVQNRHYINILGLHSSGISFADENPEQLINKLSTYLEAENNMLTGNEIEVRIGVNYGTLRKGGFKTFGCNYNIYITLSTISYTVTMDKFSAQLPREKDELFTRLLHTPLTEKEIQTITHKLGDIIYKHIDYHTKDRGIR